LFDREIKLQGEKLLQILRAAGVFMSFHSVKQP